MPSILGSLLLVLRQVPNNSSHDALPLCALLCPAQRSPEVARLHALRTSQGSRNSWCKSTEENSCFLARQKSYPILQPQASAVPQCKPRKEQNRGWAPQRDPELGGEGSRSLASPADGSPQPQMRVSYKEEEKAFLICVLFPLLLWASWAIEADVSRLATLDLLAVSQG